MRSPPLAPGPGAGQSFPQRGGGGGKSRRLLADALEVGGQLPEFSLPVLLQRLDQVRYFSQLGFHLPQTLVDEDLLLVKLRDAGLLQVLEPGLGKVQESLLALLQRFQGQVPETRHASALDSVVLPGRGGLTPDSQQAEEKPPQPSQYVQHRGSLAQEAMGPSVINNRGVGTSRRLVGSTPRASPSRV